MIALTIIARVGVTGLDPDMLEKFVDLTVSVPYEEKSHFQRHLEQAILSEILNEINLGMDSNVSVDITFGISPRGYQIAGVMRDAKPEFREGLMKLDP